MRAVRNIVTLNYGPGGLLPDVEPIPLSPNDTVTFRLGEGPKNASIKVTFEDKGCLSKLIFDNLNDKADIEVTSPLPGIIKYACELLVDGKPQAQPANPAGGTGKPGGGGGGLGN